MLSVARMVASAAVPLLLALPASAQNGGTQARIEKIKTEESNLVFDVFDNDTAFRLGLALVKEAQDTHGPQTVFDIRRNGQTLFHVSLAGSSMDNEYWVNDKAAVTTRFFASSERKQLEFQALMGADWVKAYPNGGGDPVRFWNLTPEQAHGLVSGGFPIMVKGTGFVGSIVTAGGSGSTDHDLIIAVLTRFLAK